MAINKLNAKLAASLPNGRHSDGDGLYLRVQGSARNWVFRFTVDRKEREIGLGAMPHVSLAEARRERDACRARLLAGEAPRPSAPKQIVEAKKITFGDVADDYLASHRGDWKNPIHIKQWEFSLREHCKDIRDIPVDEIETSHVLEVLKPIWSLTPETASRTRGRIEAVLDAASALKHRPAGNNPAAWKGNLAHLLPKRRKLYRGHHAALPYEQVPQFVAALRGKQYVSAKALEFVILTAARTGEALGAEWSEIDFVKKTWTVPAVRMKAGVAHTVPLCDRAIEILQEMKKIRIGDRIFPGRSKNEALSDMALLMLLRRVAGDEKITTHGFRSAFRDFAGNETHFPREICEHALSHLVGSDVERAYRRDTALEKRRELMKVWGDYCNGAEVAKIAEVVKLRA